MATLDEAYGAALEARPVSVPIDRENPALRDLLRVRLNGDGQVRPMQVDPVIRARYVDGPCPFPTGFGHIATGAIAEGRWHA